MFRLFLASVVGLSATAHALADAVEFNRDVRPILSENCYQCHGPDKAQRKKGLRLDERESALKKAAIIPRKPEDSKLIQRILSDDDTERMPPAETHKSLTSAQKETLKRWIAEGAQYQPHWAYIVPKRPKLPVLTQPGSPSFSIRNPIDAFLLARMEKENIAPSPPAEKGMLLRRLSLDLTGLPPTPEELRAFLADTDPSAYEKQVDRLLASPHYGERMAVPWLDLVRFSDTVGYHGDQNQNVFPYRDYVIDSFNRNIGFDRFTREQLAGDMLLKPEFLVASAFNRLNMMTREGGAQPAEYLAKYAADRVRTVSITWLGSTMGCAECHDHKFDPFTQRDFYSMAAFFADIKQWGVYQDYDYTPNPDLKNWSNDHPFPPEIEVESLYLKERALSLLRQIHRLSNSPALNRIEMESWVKQIHDFLKENPVGWEWPRLKPLPGTTMPVATTESGGRIVLSGKAVKGGELKLSAEIASIPGWIASIRLELVPDAYHIGRLTRDGTPNLSVQLSAALQSADRPERKLPIFFADAKARVIRFSDGFDVLGVTNSWRVPPAQKDKPSTAIYLLDQPVKLAEGDKLILTIKSDNLGCVRVSTSPLANNDASDELPSDDWKIARAVWGEGPPTTSNELYAIEYLRGTGWDPALLKKVRALQRGILECRNGRAMCMVTQQQEPRVTRVLPRGNWQDESGPIVEPGVPAFLGKHPGANTPGSPRLNRFDLAQWLVSPENPLTARVFVNRLWKQFFGVGLSAVMEDVGAQGEWPVHPGVLDWLAVEFRESGWNVKHMVRLIVTSAAYRQSSRARPELRERDPNNRLVAYQSPRRLEAEFVRDNALAIAGLLNRDIGGPSVRPYQPAGYYSQLQFPDRNYVAHADDRQYRRGVYVHWQRTFLHPMLANFDAPAREECTANRIVANTPQQALTLLNDPTFVETAKVLANRLLKERSDDAARFDYLFELALCRKPKPTEIETLTKLLTESSWTDVCRVVLNLQETMTRY